MSGAANLNLVITRSEADLVEKHTWQFSRACSLAPTKEHFN